MAHGLECMQVLLGRVVKATEFFARSTLETGSLEYHTDMGLVDQARLIVS